jgi:hypothetical protein
MKIVLLLISVTVFLFSHEYKILLGGLHVGTGSNIKSLKEGYLIADPVNFFVSMLLGGKDHYVICQKCDSYSKETYYVDNDHERVLESINKVQSLTKATTLDFSHPTLKDSRVNQLKCNYGKDIECKWRQGKHHFDLVVEATSNDLLYFKKSSGLEIVRDDYKK